MKKWHGLSKYRKRYSSDTSNINDLIDFSKTKRVNEIAYMPSLLLGLDGVTNQRRLFMSTNIVRVGGTLPQLLGEFRSNKATKCTIEENQKVDKSEEKAEEEELVNMTDQSALTYDETNENTDTLIKEDDLSKPTISYTNCDLIIQTVKDSIVNENLDKVHTLILAKVNAKDYVANDTVLITMREFKNATGLSSIANARNQLRNITEAMSGIGIRLNKDGTPYKRGGKLKDSKAYYDYLTLYDRATYDRGEAFFKLSSDWKNELENNGIPMIVLPNQLKLKGTAYSICSYLVFNKQVNYRNGENRADRVKLSTLAKHCPTLPTFKEISESNREYKRILNGIDTGIKHLEKDMVICYEDKDGNEISKDVIYPTDLDQYYLHVKEWKTLDMDLLKKLKTSPSERKDQNEN